ncbi:Protein arginine N-methyltransferase 9 [Nymphon striatum]|nr:Protein arginine N-methyltransferase 9 [Nymphon striatum]
MKIKLKYEDLNQTVKSCSWAWAEHLTPQTDETPEGPLKRHFGYQKRETEEKIVANLAAEPAQPNWLEKAMEAFQNRAFEVSLQYATAHLQEYPQDWARIKGLFMITFGYTCKFYEARKEFDTIFDWFFIALQVSKSYEKHQINLKKLLKVVPRSVCAEVGLCDAINGLVDRWHFPMLNDRVRNEKYKNAIKKTVQELKSLKNGPTVLDIGSGTGILSFIASDSGATTVYACEMSKFMCKISKKIMKSHSYNKKILVVRKHSSSIKVQSDSRVDMIVTETFDAGLLGEGVLSSLQHARKHLLKEFGRILPQKAVVWCSLVQCKRLRKQQTLIRKGGHLTILDELNVHMIAGAPKEPYTSEHMAQIRGGYEEICEPFNLINIDFNNPQQIDQLIAGEEIQWKVPCKISGNVDAVIMWFELYVDEDNCVSTAPEKESCWEQAVFHVIHAQNDKRNTLKVTEESFVYGTFKCKEHFTLQTINVINPELPEKLEGPYKTCSDSSNCELIELDHHAMQFLNSTQWVDQVLHVLFHMNRKCRIIDICDFPICGLIGLIDYGFPDIAVMHSEYDEQLLAIANANGINVDRILFIEDIFEFSYGNRNQWDILIVDPISTNGAFKNDILQDVALIKQTALVNGGLIIPDKIFTLHHAIQSEQLVQQSRIVSDENTLNYKIGEHLNKYRTRVQYDLDLQRIKHKKLSHPTFISQIHFNGPVHFVEKMPTFESVKVSKDCIALEAGSISAIAAFFLLKMSNWNFTEHALYDRVPPNGSNYLYDWYETRKNIISTLDLSGHWNQLAFIPQNEISIQENEKLNTVLSIEKSMFNIKIHENWT